MTSTYKGKFITVEGSEGSGKSTQLNLLRKYLEKAGHDVLMLREPGGVKISEKIRRILLDAANEEMNKECETLLYMAARAQLVEEKLIPALKSGKIVLCDRFLDSTVVYQGYGCGVNIDAISSIGSFATQSIEPDLTLFFDIPVKKGMDRIQNRKLDRIEQRSMDYHNKVREGYQQLAQTYKERIKTIDVDQTIEEIHKIVIKCIDDIL
ncbi:MAG: dTMP kinase [Candidatus Omnitrophota bacterium]|jgi:dTMP kinase